MLRVGRRRLGLILVVFSFAACARWRGRDASSLYREANLLRERGDLPQALALANSGLSRFSNRVSSEWYWKFRLLKTEVLLTQGNIPDASALMPGSAAEMPQQPELQARLLLDRAWAEYWFSNLSHSKQLLDESFHLAESHQLWTLVAEIKLWRARVLIRKGDAAGGEANSRDALQLARRSQDLYLEASALGNLGFLRMNTARYDEAISWFKQALALSEQLQSKTFSTLTLNNLGQCYVELGQPEQAIPLFTQAEHLAAEIGRMTDRQISLGRIGDWYQSVGKYQVALSYYERALEVAQKSQLQYWVATWLHRLAATSIEMADLARAGDYNRRALALQAQLGDPVERLWPQIDQARIAEARQQFGEAERMYRAVIQSARQVAMIKEPGLVLEARERLANLLASKRQDSEARAEFQEALALVNANRSKSKQEEYRLSYFSSLTGELECLRFYQAYVEFLVSRSSEPEALKVAESSRARVLAQRLGATGPLPIRNAEHDYRTLARTSNMILLSYWLAPRRSFLWAVTPRKVHTFTLPPQSEIEALVKAYAGEIDALRDPVRESSDASKRLYQVLLAPVEGLISSGSRVAIVPDGVLHSLNFETLPAVRAPSHYWVDDAAISVVPSLDLALGQTEKHAADAGSVLLIGDPVVSDERNFPKLSNAHLEIDRIQHQFRDAVLRTGAQAEPGAYAGSNPERFSIIHFVAHAEANYDNPLDSAIILSPHGDSYKLYARDILHLPIHARLVTISACRGAGLRAYAGEGLVGFAWAFLRAGARNVIAGLWEVDDDSTAELMDRMYSALRNGQNPAEALRMAKMALRKSQGPYSKPYYWAPFQVFTDSLKD